MRRFELDPDDPNPQIAGRKLRYRILKARREGMTTLLLALFFLDTYNNPNRRSVVIAHDADSTKALFEIVTRFYDNLPAGKIIKADRSNTDEIYWGDIDSQFRVFTAGKKNAGSGATLHNILKSERAKWPLTPAQIRAIDASLDEAGSHANIIEETTAFGLNFFHQAFNDSMAHKNTYEAVFFPWFDDPGYSNHPLTKEAPPEGFELTEDEEEKAKLYGLSVGQVYWYRCKTEERMELMPQEYPSTPQEAFIASGYPVFNRKKLQAIADRIATYPGPLKGIVLPRLEFPIMRDMYRAETLRIYRMPQIDTCIHCAGRGWVQFKEEGIQRQEQCRRCEGGVVKHTYMVTADTAEGLDPAKGDEDTFCVFDIDTWEQVAAFNGKMDTRKFGRFLCEIGWFYHTALVAPEDNNHGHAVIAAMTDDANPYPDQLGLQCRGLYFHKPELITMQHKQAEAAVIKPGWPTTRLTKNHGINILNSCIEDGDITFRDAATVGQLMTYVNKGGGTMGGEVNALDDLVTPCFIAAALLNLRFTKESRNQEALKPVTPRGSTTIQKEYR